jgi:hypothetical protein
MESLRNNAPAILLELEACGFAPTSGDDNEIRVLVRRNKDGHTDLRVSLVYGDGNILNHIAVYGLDGSPGEIIEWNLEVTGGTPLAAFHAFMRSV